MINDVLFIAHWRRAVYSTLGKWFSTSTCLLGASNKTFLVYMFINLLLLRLSSVILLQNFQKHITSAGGYQAQDFIKLLNNHTAHHLLTVIALLVLL